MQRQYFNDKGFRVLQAVDEVAREQRSTPTAVALAWLLARPVTAPIASATSVEQLNDLIAGTRLALAPAEIERLTRASA